MDFFTAQDLARRRTWRLVALFAAAVTALVIATNLLVAGVYAWLLGASQAGVLDPVAALRGLPRSYPIWISVFVAGTVALACLYKYLWLRGGGKAVAEALGGRLVLPTTADPAERRLLNVVEEMAIASGLPVPPVYVIPEPSINAFVAGLDFGDAVIGVNAGTLEHLSRDQLQGVIGHEFSHLLNGDSRLNLRLLALLHGILFIGLVGEGLLRGARAGSGRGSRRSSGNAGLPLLVLGVGLTLIGYAGTFFGKLIKAAVSRQRELLADAAAVQFTRNADGIAGALKKIGALAAGSAMHSAAAREASHLFFAPVAPAWLGRLTATHPPLGERIRAIDPGWDGGFPELGAASAEPLEHARTTPGVQPPGFVDTPPRARGTPIEAATGITAAVGTVDDQALDQAALLLAALPVPLDRAARDPWAARALLFALVQSGSAAPAAGRAWLREQLNDPALADEALRLAELATPLDEAQRLALAELVLPALKEMSTPQFRAFGARIGDLIRLDSRIDLFEWVLQRMLIRDLGAHFADRPIDRRRHRSLEQSAAAAAVLLSTLARESATPTEATIGVHPNAAEAFQAGLQVIGIAAPLDTAADPDFTRLNRALTELRALPPLQKPRLIKACAATVLANGQITARQAALLQGIGAALDCPLPASIHSARGAV